MKELIDNIHDHSRVNDPKICFFLMELIKNNEINSLEELKVYEDNNFIPINTNEKPSDEVILNNLYNSYLTDITHHDLLSVDEVDELDKLGLKFEQERNLDNKYIIMIKMYSLLDWTLYLPYHAYKYIMEDKLN